MKLQKKIFWDVDFKTLDYDLHKRYIIQRVIQRGSIEDWKAIKAYYGLDCIKNEILRIRDLDRKSHHFFSAYFNISKSLFRCYTIPQFPQTH